MFVLICIPLIYCVTPVITTNGTDLESVTTLEEKRLTSPVVHMDTESAMRELWKPRKLYKSPRIFPPKSYFLKDTDDNILNNVKNSIKGLGKNELNSTFNNTVFRTKNTEILNSSQNYTNYYVTLNSTFNNVTFWNQKTGMLNLTSWDSTSQPYLRVSTWYSTGKLNLTPWHTTSKPFSTFESSSLKNTYLGITKPYNDIENVTVFRAKYQNVTMLRPKLVSFIKSNNTEILNRTEIVKPSWTINEVKKNITLGTPKPFNGAAYELTTYKNVGYSTKFKSNKTIEYKKKYLRTDLNMTSKFSIFKICPNKTHAQPKKTTVNESFGSCIVKRKTNKYVLIWSYANDERFPLSMDKNECIDKTEREIQTNPFEHKCKYNNCYVTYDKSLVGDYTDFDVIAFGINSVISDQLPMRRSLQQKFVFVSSEPSCPIPNRYNGFFNWTWTYHLDSDLRWGGHFVIRDIESNRIIGPKRDMHWIERENMLDASDSIREVVNGKTKAVAWFLSTCETHSKREIYGLHLKTVLKNLHKIDLDIYGKCGDFECFTTSESSCDEMLKKDYYFYLAYEKILSEDFVTDTVLHALNYNTVPIVYGGANYSRFLPEGSYLNAREFNTYSLAWEIYEILHHKERYLRFFRWTNHYKYQSTSSSAETDDHCQLCALLNNNQKMKEVTVHWDLSRWWNNQIKKPEMLRDYHCIGPTPNATEYLHSIRRSGYHAKLPKKQAPVFRASKAKFQKNRKLKYKTYKVKDMKHVLPFYRKHYLDDVKPLENATRSTKVYNFDTNPQQTEKDNSVERIRDFIIRAIFKTKS